MTKTYEKYGKPVAIELVTKKGTKTIRFDKPENLTAKYLNDKYMNLKSSDKQQTNLPYDPLQALNFDINQNNILELPCFVCGEEDNVEIHHIKRLKDTKDKSAMSKIMSKINRKAIPLLRRCHDDVHAGRYSGQSLKRLNTKDE